MIGVSYTGVDGKRREFSTDGNPAPGSELDNIVRGRGTLAQRMPINQAIRNARFPKAPNKQLDEAAGTVKLNEYDREPGPLSKKVAIAGSVTAGPYGLCLKGEENGIGEGSRIYAVKDGQRGFMTLDEIDDPKVTGRRVGPSIGCDSLEPVSGDEASEGGAYVTQFQTRTAMEERDGKVYIYEFTADQEMTAGNRVKRVSGERRRLVMMIDTEGGE